MQHNNYVQNVSILDILTEIFSYSRSVVYSPELLNSNFSAVDSGQLLSYPGTLRGKNATKQIHRLEVWPDTYQ